MELWLGLIIFVCVFVLGLVAYLWHRGALKLDRDKAGLMKDNMLDDVSQWRDHLGRK